MKLKQKTENIINKKKKNENKSHMYCKIPLHLFVCLSRIAFVEVMFPYLKEEMVKKKNRERECTMKISGMEKKMKERNKHV